MKWCIPLLFMNHPSAVPFPLSHRAFRHSVAFLPGHGGSCFPSKTQEGN